MADTATVIFVMGEDGTLPPIIRGVFTERARLEEEKDRLEVNGTKYHALEALLNPNPERGFIVTTVAGDWGLNVDVAPDDSSTSSDWEFNGEEGEVFVMAYSKERAGMQARDSLMRDIRDRAYITG